jgi:hypothetical protein
VLDIGFRLGSLLNHQSGDGNSRGKKKTLRFQMRMKDKGSSVADGTYLVTMRKKRGMHADVYEDFESAILKHTGWKSLKGSVNILERLFEKFFLPRLKYRTFSFDFPVLNRDRVLFASLSGIEYIKIIQHYMWRAKLKAIYQFDSWTHDNAINENAFRSFGINIAFVSIKKSAEYFSSLQIPNFKAYWMPEAITCASYRWKDYGQKNIDILQYGRRWEWIHERLLPFCRTNTINYQYPIDSGNDKIQFKDRNALLKGLSRTRIAVCVPKTMTHPEYNLSTITTRYFECMASKCLILGHAPQDLVFLFGYNPVVEVDHADPLSQINYLLDHFDQYIPLIERNYENVKQNHQWKNRIPEMRRIMLASMYRS